MIVPEGGSPVGEAENVQVEGANIDQSVAKQEKHGNNGSNIIDRADHNGTYGKYSSNINTLGHFLDPIENGEDLIFCYSFQESRGRSQTLHPGTGRRKDNCHLYQVLCRPAGLRCKENRQILKGYPVRNSAEQNWEREVNECSG